MSVVRHEPGPILSLAVEHGDTVYLADSAGLVEVMVVAAK